MKLTCFFTIMLFSISLSAQIHNCKYYESVTAWVAADTGNMEKHFLYGGPGGLRAYSQCTWVYAHHQDVNNNADFLETHLVYTPCGGTKVEIQARVCETCLRHETRNRTYGMVPDYTESRYMQLLKLLLKTKR